jgi:hypothetical protein
MGDFKQWSSGWLREGDNIRYTLEGTTYYECVTRRDLAHFEWPWGAGEGEATPVSIPAGQASGPYVPAYLEVTKGYEKASGLNQLWQVIFGIKGQVLIYVELPTDTKRHGLPKLTWPNEQIRRIAHFEEYISPYNEPTFLTEHFMKRLETYRIEFSAYNPNAIDMSDVWLNFFVAKLETERYGTQSYTEAGVQLTPTKPHYREVLDNLYKRLIPCRPITLLPVRAPAEAGAGE